MTHAAKPCIPVLHALAMTGFADDERHIVENREQLQVLPFTPRFVSCQQPRVLRKVQGSSAYVHLKESEAPFITER
ncbi:MAG: hypothetical protein M3541_00395 [Acidobacteriota bacterium]|nr:hypothetical protein [Acidobacteriota bacterium]MDQ3417243.1 hypothetical protein [Acidobacteriota bacterium]